MAGDLLRRLGTGARRLPGRGGTALREWIARASSAPRRPTFPRSTTASVDVVVERAVLLFIEDRARAFAEYHRVLRAGGRLSLAEPLNSWMSADRPGLSLGIRRDRRHRSRTQAPRRRARQRWLRDDDLLCGFDDRDLVAIARAAGFERVEVQTELALAPPPARDDVDVFLDTAPNPLAPTTRALMAAALSTDEAARFTAVLRRRDARGTRRAPSRDDVPARACDDRARRRHHLGHGRRRRRPQRPHRSRLPGHERGARCSCSRRATASAEHARSSTRSTTRRSWSARARTSWASSTIASSTSSTCAGTATACISSIHISGARSTTAPR